MSVQYPLDIIQSKKTISVNINSKLAKKSISKELSQPTFPLFRFGETSLTYDESAHNTILDYVVKVKTLDEYDRIVQYAGTNYSVTGNYSWYLKELFWMIDNDRILVYVYKFNKCDIIVIDFYTAIFWEVENRISHFPYLNQCNEWWLVCFCIIVNNVNTWWISTSVEWQCISLSDKICVYMYSKNI